MKKHLVWIILAAALLVRLVYFFQIKDHFLFQEPILDAKYYHEWAVEIKNGDWLGVNRGVFMMSPGYSYFLAVLYKILGINISAVVLIQFLIGLVTGYLIFLIGRKTFSRTVGLIGMALYLFYALVVFYESTLLKSGLINFANVSAIYLILRGSILQAALAGCLIGFSSHLRPNIIVFVPIIITWLWFKHGQKRIINIAGFIMGILLMLLPVALRNLKVGGEFVISTAHGGMNLFTGNSAYCKGPYTPLPFARTDPEVEQADFLAEAQRRSGKMLSPKESSSFWYGQAFKYIRKNPMKWVKLLMRKTLILFNSYEPPINLDFYFFKKQYESIISLPMFGYGFVFPLAVIGLLFCNKQQTNLMRTNFNKPINGQLQSKKQHVVADLSANLLFIGYIAVYFLMGVVFFVVSEYRFPVVPVLCLYAGLGAENMFYLLKKGMSRSLVIVCMILTLAFMLVNNEIYSSFFGFPNYKRANLANSYFGLGVTYEGKGKVEDAIKAYKKAIDIMPQSSSLINLGNIYESRGNMDEAQQMFQFAIRRDPRSAEAYNNLGGLLYKKGNYMGAVGCFNQAIVLKPGFEEAIRNLEITKQALDRKR